MRTKCHAALALIFTLGLFFAIPTAFAELTVTTVLLPDEAVNEPREDSEKKLRIAADDSTPIQSTRKVRLLFNLKSVPTDAQISGATLRLVGSPAKEHKTFQQVEIHTDPQSKESIGRWDTKSDETVFTAASEALLQKVRDASRTEGRSLTFWLLSKSRLSDWRYDSPDDYGNVSARKPRLILEYKIARPPLFTPERTDWKFHLDPSTIFKPKDLPSGFKTVISNPVFYGDNLYLFAKPTDTSTNLYTLHSNGRENGPPREIDFSPGANALVNREGLLYSIGEGRIAIYDLAKEAQQTQDVRIEGLKLSSPPVLGEDGSLYFIHSGYVYGLNPDHRELWRYPRENQNPATGDRRYSQIALSRGTRNHAYVLVRTTLQDKNPSVGAKVSNHFLALDRATGDIKEYDFNSAFPDFHRPLIIERKGTDHIYLSAFSDLDGTLNDYIDGMPFWLEPVSGPVSKQASDKAGNLIFAVQNGRFKAIDALNGKTTCSASQTNLKATSTSNMVLDGEDNVYFWNSDHLYVFKKNCELLLEQEIPDLPAEGQLLFSPDGTLYAQDSAQETGNKRLILLIPGHPDSPELTLNSESIQNNTVYHADILRVGRDVHLDASTHLILKATRGIAIGPGFKVAKGARFSCKTGF